MAALLVACHAGAALAQPGPGAMPGAMPDTVPGAMPDTVPAETVTAFDRLFRNADVSVRPVHTKGVVVLGSFTPSADAAEVSRAAHFSGGPVPVIVRFSNFMGSRSVADGAADASPRGMAIRFLLPDGSDTDIVAHSFNGFPAATPEAFLRFLQAAAQPGPLPESVAASPAVQAFLRDPKPAPVSYATERFFGVNAFRFTNASGSSRFGRYQIIPMAGTAHLTAAKAASRPADYLRTELEERLAAGPAGFRVVLQLAGATDALADGSLPWPDDRPTLELGVLSLARLDPDQAGAAKALQFRPTNLVGGIAPGPDPMLLDRTRAYRLAADRRHAGE